jgi:hypothetical protein
MQLEHKEAERAVRQLVAVLAEQVPRLKKKPVTHEAQVSPGQLAQWAAVQAVQVAPVK